MKSKILAGLTALLLAAGGVAFSATSASAHTGKVVGVAVCEDDGTYSIEWTYNATNVPAGVEAETKAMTTSQGALAPIDGVNKGGQIFLSVWSDHQINVPGAPVKTGNWSAQFKTINIPGDFVGKVTTMVQTDWRGGPSEDPVGEVIVDGSCEQPPVIEKDAAASIVTIPATCEADGSARWDSLTNATGSELDQVVGSHVGIATADENHQFSGGSSSLEVPYVIEAKLDSTKEPCYVSPPQPPKPEAQQQERVTTDVRCDIQKVELTYQEHHTVEPTFDEELNTWSDPVWTEWDTVGIEQQDVTEQECPTPSSTPVANVTSAILPPEATTLAATGSEFSWIVPVTFVGTVILGGGVWLSVMAYRRRSE